MYNFNFLYVCCWFMLIFHQHSFLFLLSDEHFQYVFFLFILQWCTLGCYMYILNNDNCIVCIHFSFPFFLLINWISVSFMNDLNKRNFSSLFKYFLPCYGIIYYTFLSFMLFCLFILMEIVLQFVLVMAIINYLIIRICEWDSKRE